MTNNATYGWIFTKGLDGNWSACKRDHYFELFSGNKGNVLKSSSIKTLEELIVKTDGDQDKILKLLNK